MTYELRIGGVPKAQFGTEEAAVAAARDVIRENADADVEIFDLTTGRACAPGASKRWRDELANRVGF
jgi:hypothetical protein